MNPSGFDNANIVGLFDVQYEESFAGSWASELGLMVASDSAEETYGFLGVNAPMREWIGARQSTTLNKTQYSIKNRRFESTLVIAQRDLDRDKTGLLTARVKTFAAAAGADHWQALMVELVNGNGLCYDGKTFFAADHVFGDSGTQVNELGATQVPSSNVGSATAPTPTEMASCILEATAHMLTIKNDKGRPANGQARAFHIQVATAQMYSAAIQAISANLLNGTLIDNPLAGMKAGGFRYSVSMESRLTSMTDKFNIYRTDGGLKPFLLQSEQEITPDVIGPGSDFWFDHEAWKLGVKARRAVGYGMWEHAARVTFT